MQKRNAVTSEEEPRKEGPWTSNKGYISNLETARSKTE